MATTTSRDDGTRRRATRLPLRRCYSRGWIRGWNVQCQGIIERNLLSGFCSIDSMI